VYKRQVQPHLIPTQPHPAHAWAAQRLAGQDKGVHARDGMVTVYSQYLAGHLAGTAFVGSFTPKHMRYMLPWRRFTAQALLQPELASILRRAQVGVVLTSPEQADLAKRNTALRFVQCFDPGPASHYYPIPLCAFEVLPRDDDFFNIQPVTGFSDFEESMVAIEDGYARAGWRTSRLITHTLDLDLQPCCSLHGEQSVAVKINGQIVVTHTWTKGSDERWKAKVMLAPSKITPSWNTVELLTAEATVQLAEQQSAGRQTMWVHRLRVLPLTVLGQRSEQPTQFALPLVLQR